MNEPDLFDQVVRGLDALIRMSLRGVGQERYYPSPNPDDMDDRIKHGREKAAELRKLRERFEDLMTGAEE